MASLEGRGPGHLGGILRGSFRGHFRMTGNDRRSSMILCNEIKGACSWLKWSACPPRIRNNSGGHCSLMSKSCAPCARTSTRASARSMQEKEENPASTISSDKRIARWPEQSARQAYGRKVALRNRRSYCADRRPSCVLVLWPCLARRWTTVRKVKAVPAMPASNRTIASARARYERVMT